MDAARRFEYVAHRRNVDEANDKLVEAEGLASIEALELLLGRQPIRRGVGSDEGAVEVGLAAALGARPHERALLDHLGVWVERERGVK